jgi:hypothetical protein
MKQDSKHWLQWRGTREGNQLIFARPWTPAIQATDPNYLRNRFAEIRADIAWAEAMERQANYEEMREEWMAWETSPALVEAVQQIEFKWDTDYEYKTGNK